MIVLDLIMFFASIIMSIAFGFNILNEYVEHHTINWVFVCFEVLCILMILKLMGAFEVKDTLERRQKKWKFKSYKDVEQYLEVHKPHLQYEKEDKELLISLLFFDWEIIDDSNPEELVVHRKTTTSDDTKIMKMKIKTTNKKSL